MAVLTNSICSKNSAIDIQANGGTINIATDASASSFLFGTNATGQSFVVQSGDAGAGLIATGGGVFLNNLGNGGAAMSCSASSSADQLVLQSGSAQSGPRLLMYDDFIASSIARIDTQNSNPFLVSIGTNQTGSKVNIIGDATGVTSINNGISTAPVNSSVATAAFVTSLTAGTSVRNTTGYNLLVNICVNITAATGATITLGVGAATGPTANTVITSFTTAAVLITTFSAIVPNNYYLVVNTTGTITVGSISAQSCPL